MSATCKCGFNYSRAFVEKTHKIESFAVTPDKKYKKVSKLDAKYRKTKKAKYFCKAADMVGSIWICPECGTYVLTMPKAYEYEARFLHVDSVEPAVDACSLVKSTDREVVDAPEPVMQS